MARHEVPHDPGRSPRENLLEWVGDDDRVNELVGYCDMHGIRMDFCPDDRICCINVLGPDGGRIARGSLNSMVIDLDTDVVTLLGSTDIRAGIRIIERVYKAAGQADTDAELRKLLRL